MMWLSESFQYHLELAVNASALGEHAELEKLLALLFSCLGALASF